MKSIHMKVIKKESNKARKEKVALNACTSSKTNINGGSHGRQMRCTTKALQAAGAKVPKARIQKITECISGMLPLTQRKQLQKLLNGEYDTVYVESLRALGRKASVIEEVYDKARETNTKLITVDMPGLLKLNASPTECFIRRVQAAVQEYERDMIVHLLQQELFAKRRALERAHPNQKIKVNGRKSLLEQHAISASQQKKLQDVCKQKQGGAFGWRPLAKNSQDC